MYHPPSKRVRFWRRFSVIAIMWVAVISGVIVLTALTLGYGFNQKDGRIEQGGILQLDSEPTGAAITINNAPFSSETPTKLVSQPGDYAVTMNKPGYRQWQKTVPIQAGNITWVAYPRLIPKKLTPTKVATFAATTSSALASPSSKRYAVLPNPATPSVTVASLDVEEVKTADYALPHDLYTQPSEGQAQSTFAIESWTGDEKKILLDHVYGDAKTHEWIILNLDKPEESVNINRTFGIDTPIIKPLFSRNDGSVLYAIVGDSVRILNLHDETMSRPLVENAVDFRLYGDEFVLYVAQGSDKVTQQVGYVKKDYKKPRVVKTVPYDGLHNAQFDAGKYYSKYYYLVSNGTHAELFAGSVMPNDSESSLSLKSVYKVDLAQPILDTNVTDNGQFATVQDGSSFATHNLETSQSSKSSLAEGAAPLPQKLKYLDGYLLWGTRNGLLHTYEFDGANQQDIMPIVPELGATLSPSAKYLYAFAHEGNAIVLTRVQLLDIKVE